MQILDNPESGNTDHRPHTNNGYRFCLPTHSFFLLKTLDIRPQPLGTMQGIMQSLGTIVKKP